MRRLGDVLEKDIDWENLLFRRVDPEGSMGFCRREGDACESPIEAILEHALAKFLLGSMKIIRQFKVQADRRIFRMDMVVETPAGKRIGFECDGKDFHDRETDSRRDSLILRTGAVQEICRIPGHAINYRLEDTLYALSLWYPQIFAERGRWSIERNASIEALENWTGGDESYVRYARHSEDEGRPVPAIVVLLASRWRFARRLTPAGDESFESIA